MSDQLERADEATELFMREALTRHRVPTLKPTGFCYYCVSEIKPGCCFVLSLHAPVIMKMSSGANASLVAEKLYYCSKYHHGAMRVLVPTINRSNSTEKSYNPVSMLVSAPPEIV